jgi:hypothetical protein
MLPINIHAPPIYLQDRMDQGHVIEVVLAWLFYVPALWTVWAVLVITVMTALLRWVPVWGGPKQGGPTTHVRCISIWV